MKIRLYYSIRYLRIDFYAVNARSKDHMLIRDNIYAGYNLPHVQHGRLKIVETPMVSIFVSRFIFRQYVIRMRYNRDDQ